ncbi:hypothetical protein KJ855_03860 [Patescibacteria group bacterium]|nr:hypothetical protein [Patescibacteria group bacterium]
MEKEHIFLVPNGALESWFTNEDGELYDEVENVVKNPYYIQFMDKIVESMFNE